jgi:phage-related protein (TIGR01555 family)
MSKKRKKEQSEQGISKPQTDAKFIMPGLTEESSKLMLDAFSNLPARLGYQSSNLLESTTYYNTRMTRDFMLMLTLYRSNWLARKIIDMVAEDMLKNWYQVISGMTPQMIDQLQKLERRTKTRVSVLTTVKWGRLFGGGASIMIIKGHEDILDQPLDLTDVMPGSYRGLIPLDRWSGITPGDQLIEDIDSPDFGLPSSYTVTLTQGGNFEIHSSRVLRCIGRDLPNWEKQAEMYWGVSEIEIIFEELRKRDNTSFNIAGLVFLANIRVLTLPHLSEVLGLGSQQVQEKLYGVLRAQNDIMSNMGMMVLPKDGAFDTKQYSFSGINDIYESFMLDISGASNIPVTKLFGRSPAGMNATGEADTQNYYDFIGQCNESQTRPILEKLLPVICTSLWGQVPNDMDFKFPSAQTIPMERMAEIAGKFTSSIIEAYQADIITKRAAAKELRQLEDQTGLFSNITDEDIANATDEYQSDQSMGEMGMPGAQSGASSVAEGGPKPENTMGAKPAASSADTTHNAISELRALIQQAKSTGKADTSPLRQKLEASKQKQDLNTHADEQNKALLSQIKSLQHYGVHMTRDYIACDLDGTLAKIDKSDFDPNFIGSPVDEKPDAVFHKIKKMIAQGKDVRILTARVANLKGAELKKTENLIQDWTEEHLGKRLPVTCVKDPEMEILYDDRAIAVEKNTGVVK